MTQAKRTGKTILIFLMLKKLFPTKHSKTILINHNFNGLK